MSFLAYTSLQIAKVQSLQIASPLGHFHYGDFQPSRTVSGSSPEASGVSGCTLQVQQWKMQLRPRSTGAHGNSWQFMGVKLVFFFFFELRHSSIKLVYHGAEEMWLKAINIHQQIGDWGLAPPRNFHSQQKQRIQRSLTLLRTMLQIQASNDRDIGTETNYVELCGLTGVET